MSITGILVSGVLAVSGGKIAEDGTYSAEGRAVVYNSAGQWLDDYNFEVSVTVKDGAITNISQDFIKDWEPLVEYSYDYHLNALYYLTNRLRGKPASISSVDEYAVDAVTGATYSYNALRTAVRKALESAPESTGGEAVTKYTVAYDLNGAPGEAPEPAFYAPGETVTVIADPSWADHIFDGWSGAEISDGSFVMPSEDVTLTAQWLNRLSVAPGEPKSVIVEPGKYAVDMDYSGAGLTADKEYQSIYAQYDSNGRMLQVATRTVTFDSAFHTDMEIENPEIGRTYKLFLLDSDSFIPQCPNVQFSFAARTPDGAYAGSAQCRTGYMNYMVDVNVTVKDGIITFVTDQTLKTPMSATDKAYYASAWNRIRDSISDGRISADNYQAVDAVSGATISSQGINSAIEDALSRQTPAAGGEAQGDMYAPEGISLYARVYPVVTVADGKITDIRIVPVKDTDTEFLAAFAKEIIRKQSVEGLAWPEAIQDDAYAVASLIDQILYGKGVLQ